MSRETTRDISYTSLLSNVSTEGNDMASHRSTPSHGTDAKSGFGSADGQRGRSSVLVMGNPEAPDGSAGPADAPKSRRLIADQLYFGFGALALRSGARRVLARQAAQAPRQARIDVRILGEDFRLDAAASRTFLSALLAAGLLQPDGTGGYQLTTRFREYAGASVVAPLSRERAKTLIARANDLACRINAGWTQNPYRIQAIAVSGSVMSRCDPLPELTLCLVLHRRQKLPGRHLRSPVSKDDALRPIVAAMKDLSSFIVVRVAADLQGVHRPFSVVFEADDDATAPPASAWDKLRDLGASVGQRLVLK